MNKESYIDSFKNEVKDFVIKNIEEKLPEARKEDFYLFKETGNRLVYEGEYFGRRKFLTAFGMVLEFYEDFNLNIEKEKIADKLSYIIEDICKEKFWALPAHVNFEKLDECTVDLFASETAGTLAEMLYLFKEELAPETIEIAKKEIIRRVLKPFCESSFPYSWWEKDKCNWSSVCAGNIGIACIYMDKMNAMPKNWVESCLARVCDALKCYLAGMEEDGACTEGLGYFSYGMSYFTAFAEIYKEEKNIDLMANEKVHKIGTFQQKCYFGNGISVSFSDGHEKETFLPGLTAFLKANYNDVEMPDFSLAKGFEADSCYRWVTNERNLRWLKKYDTNVNSVKQGAKYYLLPSAQWMIVEDELGNGFAAKGGNNAENHNHNDIGHFLCVYNGEMLLTDLGAGEYTKDYFNDGRYGILCNRSLGHSVPLINDMEQCTGKEFQADAFNWNEENKTLEISFAGAYEKNLIKKITRKISMSKENNIVLEDYFEESKNTKTITESLVTSYKPQLMADYIMISGEKGNCRITGFSAQPEIIPMDHSKHDGTKVTVYLIHWPVDFKEKNTEKINIQFLQK